MIANICQECQAPFDPVLLKRFGRMCSFECHVKHNEKCIEIDELLCKFYKKNGIIGEQNA